MSGAVALVTAAAGDLGSGLQGGSSADPGVDTIVIFAEHVRVPLCKLYMPVESSLSHTRFTSARVHPA